MFYQVVDFIAISVKYATIYSQLGLLAGLMYMGWWVWTFVMRPKFYSQEPKTYPYWIPGLGNTAGFFRNTHETIDRARLYFNNTREPFTLIVGGQPLYVLTSALHVSELYKSPSQLTFDDYVRGMLMIFMKNESAVTRMYTCPPPYVHETNHLRLPNPKKVCVSHLGEAVLLKQLSGGEEAAKTEGYALRMIQDRLKWSSLPGQITSSPKANCRVLSLKALCQDVLLQCTSRALFGNALMDINPDLPKDFLNFDDESWKLNYRVPELLSRGMHSSLEAIREAFTRYIDLPSEAKPDVSWMVPTIENELCSIGLTSREQAGFFASLFWAANSNSWRLIFWMLSYILHSPDLHQKIQKEVLPHIENLSLLNEVLPKLQACKWLMATYQETLRITISSTSVRHVSETCVIGSKVLQKDAQVIIPYRQMLMDNRVFGADASTFNPARFVNNPGLLNHSSYRPFGGGITYCPGRHLASKEALLTVSLMVGQYRLEKLDSSSAFPAMNTIMPCVGVMAPVKDADMQVVVKKLS